MLNEYHIQLTENEYEQLVAVINKVEHTPQQLKGFAAEQIPQLLNLIDLAFLRGLKVTMWIGMAFTLISALLVFKLKLNQRLDRSSHAPMAL